MLRFLEGEKHLNLVRSLIMVEIVAMLIFTAVGVGVECLIFILFIISGELRQRFVASFKQPMVLTSMLFYAMITAGLFYGVASREEALDFWSAWRKLLLVPLTVSVFDEPIWKRRMATFFVGFASVAALVSAVSYFLNFQVYYRFSPGIVLDNHAAQGMVFALAVFTSVVLLRFLPPSGKGFWITVAGLGIITINLIFITPGRSGYLAFLVFVMVAIFVTVPGKRRYIILVIVPIVVGLCLYASPVARERITKGVSEIAALEQSEQLTSMGIRMVMWKNTLGILTDPDFPLLAGYGTGGFKEAYRPQVAGQTGWKAEVVDDCHNQYMRIAVEHGAIGLLLFLGFIAACLRQSVSRPFKVLGIGALIAWCATSLFSGHFGTFAEGRLIYVWSGAMLAMPALPTHRQDSLDSRPSDQDIVQ